MEKYYLVKKDYALRAGLNEMVREEINGDLLLSERDIRMISLTVDEKVAAIQAVEYIESSDLEPEVEPKNEDE